MCSLLIYLPLYMSMCSFFDLTSLIVVGMASSGSMTRPPCANQEDMPNKWEDASLDKVKEKDCQHPALLVWRCLQGEGVHRPKESMDGRVKIFCMPELCL